MPRAMPAADAATPYPGARFATSIVAANIAGYRKAASPTMNQRDLADRMRAIGLQWSQATVSLIENARRPVTVDELLGLAIALGVTVPALLDPAGVAGTDERHVGLLPADTVPPAAGDREEQLLIRPMVPNALARAWVAGKALVRLEPATAEAMVEQFEASGIPHTHADAEADIRRTVEADRVPFQLTHAAAPIDRTPSYAEAVAELRPAERRALAFLSAGKEHRR
jgi:transcriptional regulator with XRE-family HTH domain